MGPRPSERQTLASGQSALAEGADPSRDDAYLTGGTNGQGSGAYNLGGITYAPDGDVLSANDSVNGQWTYEYGPLNRLLEACSPSCTSPATALQYVYDRFGNRWQENVLAGSGPSAQLTFDANNRIAGTSYDASGDLLAQGSNTFTYDAEGRIASANSGAIQYVYDAFGHRVEKITPAGTFYYLHDLSGRPITELASTGGFNRGEVYLGGRHLATYSNSTTYFDYADWLATERMRATVSGYEQDACTSWPFGAGLSCTGPGADPSPMHFAGRVRDAATGLDHFPARYYTNNLGRWITPDPLPWTAWQHTGDQNRLVAFLSDPEHWDMYAYVGGNPTTLADPSGEYQCAGDRKQCLAAKRIYKLLVKADQALKAGSAARKRLDSILKTLGKPGQKTGVFLRFASLGGAMGTTGTAGKTTTITLDLTAMGKEFATANASDEEAGVLAHEGMHAVDQRAEGMPLSQFAELTLQVNGDLAQAEAEEGLRNATIYRTWSPTGGINGYWIGWEARQSTVMWCAESQLCP